jgi:hypothetical protein
MPTSDEIEQFIASNPAESTTHTTASQTTASHTEETADA